MPSRQNPTSPVEASTELALALAFYRQIRASAHFADLKKLLATMLVD